MAMPDKRATRPWLVQAVAQEGNGPIRLAQAAVLLALADAEWAREEAAERQALLALLAADLANQAEAEDPPEPVT